MLSVKTIVGDVEVETKSFFRTEPNGQLEFRGKTKVLQQYCDMTRYKNSKRQVTFGRLAKGMDLGHTRHSKL